VGTPQALVNMGCPAMGQLLGPGRLKFDATGRLPALPDRSCSGLWTNPSCGLAASGDNKRPLGDRLRRSMRRLSRRPNKAAPRGLAVHLRNLAQGVDSQIAGHLRCRARTLKTDS